MAHRNALLRTTLLAAALAAGCAGAGGPRAGEASAASDSSGPIWRRSALPWALGPVSLVQGDSALVSLDATVAGGGEVVAVERAVVDPPNGLTVSADGTSLRIAAGSGAEGLAAVSADVRLADGSKATVGFPVQVSNLPLVDFAYVPQPGKQPALVAVAGEFNGWSANANPMAKGADGKFAAKVPVRPGTWSYKLVVDGEWISDPGNPRKDSSGYGNSILEVSGTVLPPLGIRTLGGGMPGAGAQGGVAFDAPAKPEATLAWLNNLPLAPEHWRLSDDGLRLTLHVPDALWGGENNVVVAAEDATGRRGVFAGRFDDADAPRSPMDEVLYFAMTDRFRNGDTSNDPKIAHEDLHPLANYQGGDWAGIRQAIEEGYFDDLGVTTVWVSPPNRNTMKVERDGVPPHRLFSSYHGYWPVSTTETNPAFGSVGELKGMVDAAHGRGIAVMLDFVVNHVHEDHPMFAEHPEWFSGLNLPDGTANIRKFDEHPFSTWFDVFLPNIDYSSGDAVVEAMTDNGVYWIEATGVDGFRQDAVKHVEEVYWRRLTEKLNERFPDRTVLQIGETISDRGTISKFIGPDMLQGQFDFPMLWAMQGAVAREQGSMADLASAIEGSQTGYPSGAIMSPLIGNHDVVRFMGLADGDIPETEEEQKRIAFEAPPTVDDPASYDKLELAYAILFALPGPPTIYYGDEIGMTGSHDPDNRRMKPWDDLAPEQERVRARVGELGKLRGGSPALRRGRAEILRADAEALALARVAPGEVVVAVYGRKPAGEQTVELPAHWGTPRRLEVLSDKGAVPRLEGNRLVWEGAARSFAICRLEW